MRPEKAQDDDMSDVVIPRLPFRPVGATGDFRSRGWIHSASDEPHVGIWLMRSPLQREGVIIVGTHARGDDSFRYEAGSNMVEAVLPQGEPPRELGVSYFEARRKVFRHIGTLVAGTAESTSANAEHVVRLTIDGAELEFEALYFGGAICAFRAHDDRNVSVVIVGIDLADVILESVDADSSFDVYGVRLDEEVTRAKLADSMAGQNRPPARTGGWLNAEVQAVLRAP